MSKPLPGLRWRILAHYRKETRTFDHQFEPKDNVEFDELVVGDWFHMEQMDNRIWWMRIGRGDESQVVWVTIPPSGPCEITVRPE